MAEVSDLYRYEIVCKDSRGRPKRIASHGMGEIYKANDLLNNEIVALKVVREQILAEQGDRAKRAFLAEAMAGARLGKTCPQIVRVYDIGQMEDILYMAQEWIPGGNLAVHCGNISLYKARTAILQIAKAVQAAHAEGIVHSDISPDNILFDNRKEIYKLSDFGLLKLINKTSSINRAGASLLKGGKKAYMPKDHWDDVEKIDQSTDVYALGVVFFQLITGELPPSVDGAYVEPGLIAIAGDERRPAPPGMRQLFSDFVVRHREDHRIDEFIRRVSIIPA